MGGKCDSIARPEGGALRVTYCPGRTYIMPVTSPVSLSKIVAEFGGNGQLASYYRGGPYVPNIPANNAISTTANGLMMSQFEGATNAALTVTASPSVIDVNAGSGIGGPANAGIGMTATGGVAPYTVSAVWASGGAGISIGYPPPLNIMLSVSRPATLIATGVLRITVTDSLGSTGTVDVPVTFRWS